MYIYDALINALSAHMIHINLNMIFYTHIEHSPTKYFFKNAQQTDTQTYTYIWTWSHVSRNKLIYSLRHPLCWRRVFRAFAVLVERRLIKKRWQCDHFSSSVVITHFTICRICHNKCYSIIIFGLDFAMLHPYRHRYVLLVLILPLLASFLSTACIHFQALEAIHC